MVTTALPAADARTAPQAKTRLKLIDADVHNAINSIDELLPFLATRWHSLHRAIGIPDAGNQRLPAPV